MTANYPTYKLPEWTYDKTIGCRIRNRDVIRQFCRSPTTLAANIETFRAIESYKSMIMVLCWKDDDFPDDNFLCRTDFYLTIYRKGQKSLFSGAREPTVGPYWIPENLRS